MHKKYFIFPAIVIMCLIIMGQTKEEQNITHDILLFNLHVEWPAEYLKNDSFIIGVLDRDKRLSGYIEYKLRHKKIKGKPVAVRTFLDAGDVAYSNILVVSRARNRKIDNVFNGLNVSGVLVISDHGKDDNYLMINYTNARKKEFDIYPQNISDAGLGISNDLMQYANNKLSLQELYYISEKALIEKRSEIKTQASFLNQKIEKLDSLSSESERKNALLKLQEQNLKLQSRRIEEETQRLHWLKGRLRAQQLVSLMVVLVGILLLGMVVLLAYHFQIKKNVNKKLHLKNEAIQQQKSELIFKNKQITDSINYAKRIQSAILADETELRNSFTDMFIFYLPRDIVSGDFYWYSKINDGYIFISVDCTGHGVPGALMSMIGNTLLNQIVKENQITNPAEILLALHHGIVEALHQERKEIYAQDGMDASALFVANNKKKGVFSGANQSIYQVKNNSLKSFEGEFITLGGVSKYELRREVSFKNIALDLSDSMIYLFSDGYVDQFGGPKNKKYNISRFKQKLIEISGQPTAVQKNMLHLAHKRWKGGGFQIDDLMVAGLKF